MKSKKSKKRNECIEPRAHPLSKRNRRASKRSAPVAAEAAEVFKHLPPVGILHATWASMVVEENTGHSFTKVYDERTLVFTKFLSKCMGAGQPMMPPPPGLGFEILSLLIRGVPGAEKNNRHVEHKRPMASFDSAKGNQWDSVLQELPQDGPAFKVARGHRAICDWTHRTCWQTESRS